MSTATVSTTSAARTTPATCLPTHPGSGRKVFACKAEVWDEVFAFADRNGYEDARLCDVLDAWLQTKQVH